MRRLVVILLFVLGVYTFEHGNIFLPYTTSECEVVDLHHEQLLCNHRYNIDAERTSTIVVPSLRTVVNSSPRCQQNRTLHLAIVGRSLNTSNYLISLFIHRLGSCARAVDFYLYTLCRLRL